MEFITFLLIMLFIFIVLTFIFLTFNIINPKKYITFVSMSHLLGVVTTLIFIIINIDKEKYVALGLIAIVTFLWSNFSAIAALLQFKNKLENNLESMNNLEKQYTQSQSNLNKAYELDRMKSEFIANISHDLRTPINILFSSIQLYELYFNKKEFSKDQLDEESYKMNSYLKIMRQNCCRLIKLVNNLIDISKIDAGFKNLNLRYCDVVSVIEDITTSVIPYAESRGLYIEFDSQLEEKLIMCDVDNLERIILNLAANAIKFSQKDGVIRINLMEEDKFIVVSIRDEGVGISPEMQEIIFKRFFQVSQHSTKGKEGSGIGLYLVKSLVEMQGGTIKVSSKINKGSEFIFTIPAIEKPDEVSEDSIVRELETKNLEIELSDI